VLNRDLDNLISAGYATLLQPDPYTRFRYNSPDPEYPWNQTAFRVLWQVFQMTVSELPKGFSPGITIAK
jgi:hypothetical protein